MNINTVPTILFRLLNEVRAQHRQKSSRPVASNDTILPFRPAPDLMTPDRVAQFAAEWIAAWNARDLDRILALYADDFEMSSPKIIHYMGEPTGKLRGKPAIRAYWKRALAALPDLQFQLQGVYAGVDSICLSYESQPGSFAVEWFRFNEAFKVARAAAHYAADPAMFIRRPNHE